MTDDEEIGAMLRAIDESDGTGDRGHKLDDARTAALHGRIMARAARRLADLRQRVTWWDYSAQWSRAAIPVGLAASLLAGALWYGVPREGALPATMTNDGARQAISVAVTPGVGTTEMLDSLVGPVSRDALVSALLGGGR